MSSIRGHVKFAEGILVQILSKLWVIAGEGEGKAGNMNLRSIKMWRILKAIKLGEITKEVSLGREGRH